MVLYWIVYLCLLLGVFSVKKNKGDGRTFVFLVLLLFLIGFFRKESVGADVLEYCDAFSRLRLDYSIIDNIDFQEHEMEYGFIGLSLFIRLFVSNPLTYIHILFLITFCNTVVSIKRLSVNKPLSLYIYYALSFYFFTFNGIRQALAISLILLIVSYLPKKMTVKKMFLFIMTIAIAAYLFHKSLIVACLVPVIVKYKDARLLSNKYLAIGIVVSMVLSKFFIAPIASTISGIDISALNSEMYSGYLSGLEAQSSFSYLSNFLHAFFAIFILLIASKDTNDSNENNEWLKVYAVGTIIFVLFSPLNWLFIRLTDNLRIFIIFAIPSVMAFCKEKRVRKILVLALLLYCTVLFWNRLQDDNYGDVVPYKCVLID